jgi:hypothetical protein
VLTDHFVVYTTEKSPVVAQAMPGFLEAALAHYRVMITPLPEPGGVMDTYVLADRGQWQMLSRMLLGDERAGGAASVQRGGLTYRGRSMIFDLGPAETLAIAAHEGWHQYTQLTFRQPLPVWLEESLATLAEGHAWAGPTPVFLPWANPARFDRLREAFERGEVLSVEQIITSTPGALLGGPGTEERPGPRRGASVQDAAAAWYSHAWALGLYLREHAGPEARRGLERALLDARAGTVDATIAASVGSEPGRVSRVMLGPGGGSLHFRAYFGVDPSADADFNRGFQAFVDELVRPGTRAIITQGRSPIQVGSGLAPTATPTP